MGLIFQYNKELVLLRAPTSSVMLEHDTRRMMHE
jgi:hypothetical protein